MSVVGLMMYPGGDLVAKGLADIANASCSEEALLVLIAGPSLRSLGFDVQELAGVDRPYEHALYEKIEQRSASPHADYNSLIRRITSFSNAYACRKMR